MNKISIACLEGFAHFQRDEDEYYADPEAGACGCGQDDCPECDGPCTYCDGHGSGIVGLDWDCSDGINGPYDGEDEQCPNCHGSGRAKDMTFW